MGSSLKSARFLIESRLIDAARGDWNACYDLGVDYSTGANGVDLDLVEAHKWFNLAASRGGHEGARHCRAEVADEMTAREIAEAQTRARSWLNATSRRAA
ncbi:SEL1-like repeat protein [Sphingomonas pruni]|jgi:TPR repeat protein|uniref:SEL1-like repeat protein n=1 Tax=Sphingomonas pruni TaxID=40683 RepID=UPI00082D4C94|nr:sel1 repeat family protein [Sphingomonas pruni]